MKPKHACAPDRPSVLLAAMSPTAIANLLSSLLLLAAIFLPHSVESGQSTVSLFSSLAAKSSSGFLVNKAVVFWPFEFAFLTFLVTLALVLCRPSWFATALLAIPVFSAVFLLLRLLVALFSDAEMSRAVMAIAAVVTPIAGSVAARMLWLYRSGEITAAATWGQTTLSVLAVFSLKWFWIEQVTALQSGGFLAISSALLMMLASWTWIPRAHYDFFDRSVRPAPFQVSLRQLVLAMTAIAIALAYWQAFSFWAD